VRVYSLWQNVRKHRPTVFGSTHSNNTEGLQNLTSLHKHDVCIRMSVAGIATLAITRVAIEKYLLSFAAVQELTMCMNSSLLWQPIMVF
jgi:hypothetical protein